MGPSLRAFVQVDRGWQAIPIAPADHQADQVTKVDEKRLFRFTFRPNVASFDELIRGYLHIRFINSMIVADKAEPSSDVFDRTDDYYIYLRAHSFPTTRCARPTAGPIQRLSRAGSR